MTIESKFLDTVPSAEDGEGASDEEPGPSPASVVVLNDAWRNQLPDAAGAVHAAVNAAAAFVPGLPGADVAIALSSDEAVRALNARYRGQDKPTNVLSFPAADPSSADAPSGDIIIALETVLREAEEEGKPPLHHLAHLTVHGVLHLAGYDHETEEEAECMEGLERRILAGLDIPDPYRSFVEEDLPPLAAVTRI
jgi:probable rRNA maturation factor